MKTIEQVKRGNNPYHAAFANHCWNACLKVGINPHGMKLHGHIFEKKTAFGKIVVVESHDLSGCIYVDVRLTTKDGTIRCVYDPVTNDILDTDVYNTIEAAL